MSKTTTDYSTEALDRLVDQAADEFVAAQKEYQSALDTERKELLDEAGYGVWWNVSDDSRALILAANRRRVVSAGHRRLETMRELARVHRKWTWEGNLTPDQRRTIPDPLLSYEGQDFIHTVRNR